MKKIKLDKDIDSKNLNDIIGLSKKILRILYIVIIAGIIFLGTLIIKEWGIITFITSLLKILAPLFIGFIIAWLFNPVVSFLKKKGISRTLSATIVYAVFIAILYILIRLLIPSISNQFNDLINIIPITLDKCKDFINEFFNNLSNIGKMDFVSIEQKLYVTIENWGIGITNSIPNTLFSIISGLFSGIGTFVISLIIGFYMLLNFNSINQHIITLIPVKYRKEVQQLFDQIGDQIKKFVNGTLLTSLIIAVLSTVGFAIIGLKAPLLFGLFCGITNIIPYIGPYVGGAPAVLVGFSQSPAVGIIALIYIVVIQMIEGNIINPLIMSKTMKLHPVSIIIGLIVFGNFFGIVGMIFATPIIALIKILYQFFATKYNWFDYSLEGVEKDGAKKD